MKFPKVSHPASFIDQVEEVGFWTTVLSAAIALVLGIAVGCALR